MLDNIIHWFKWREREKLMIELKTFKSVSVNWSLLSLCKSFRANIFGWLAVHCQLRCDATFCYTTPRKRSTSPSSYRTNLWRKCPYIWKAISIEIKRIITSSKFINFHMYKHITLTNDKTII